MLLCTVAKKAESIKVSQQENVNHSDITETEMEVEESEEYSVSLETKLEKVWEAMSTIIDRGKVDHQNTKVNETKLNVI